MKQVEFYLFWNQQATFYTSRNCHVSQIQVQKEILALNQKFNYNKSRKVWSPEIAILLVTLLHKKCDDDDNDDE